MFLIYFTCFGLTLHHQVYSACLKSLLYFPFDVSNTSRCFFQVILRHAWFICNMHQVIFVFFYTVGIICYICFSIIALVVLLTFVKYVAIIFPAAVVYALLYSAWSPCHWLRLST
jgi:hypothetical protein